MDGATRLPGRARTTAPSGSRRPRASSGQARMMFLTGRKVDEPEAGREAIEGRAEEREGAARAGQERQGAPAGAPGSVRGRSWSRWHLHPGDRDFFARAIVNRIWHRLFGQGLVMPLDQMHSANPPSHPELLAWLARDTVDARLRPPPADPRAGPEPGLCPRAAAGMRGEPPRPSLFAVAAVRPLTPDATGDSRSGWRPPTRRASPTDSPPSARAADRAPVEGRAGRSPRRSLGSSGDDQIGVAEALLFSNGKRIAQRAAGRRRRPAGRPPEDRSPTPAEQVELAVRNVLSRPPDDEEIRAPGALPRATHRPARRGLPAARLGPADRPEFRFNH